MTDKKPILGFIGIGLMGRPMALRLLDHGYRLHVWNRSAGKLATLVDKGAEAEGNPAAVARSADIVFLCLTNDAAVEEVAEGLIVGGAAGKLIVDFSTISPAATRRLATTVRDKAGMDWVDAPVSGGVPGAETGTLAIMCGGAADHVARVRPVLDCLAARVTHMGPVGSGQATKICNQLIVSSNLVAIAEAVTLGRRAGIDVEKLAEALAGGWADSKPLQLFGPRMAAGTLVPKLSAISTMLKDVRSILSLAADLGVDTHLVDAAGEVYGALEARGLSEVDLSCLTEYYRDERSG